MSKIEKAIALFVLLLISSIFAAFCVCNFHLEPDLPKITFAAAVILLPCWLFIAPLFFLINPERSNIRSIFFVMTTVFFVALIIPAEAYSFFKNTPSNAMPEAHWFLHATMQSATYALVIGIAFVICMRRLYGKRNASI